MKDYPPVWGDWSEQDLQIKRGNKSPLHTGWAWVVLALLCLPCLLMLSGCIAIPLPDEGPQPNALEIPVVGSLKSQVHASMGIPPVLATDRFEVYTWGVDRNFVITAAPLGIPVGLAGERNSCRLLVEYDDKQRVRSSEFYDRLEDGTPQRPSAFSRLKENREGMVFERARWLKAIEGLGAHKFLHPELDGVPSEMRLSPDGSLLLAVDQKNQGWIVDIRKDLVLSKCAGTPIGFWDLRPPGALRLSVNQTADTVLLTQFRVGTRLLKLPIRAAPGASELEIAGFSDFIHTEFPFGRASLMGLETDSVVEFDPSGEILGRYPIAGLLAFKQEGVSLEKPAAAGELMAVRLQIPSIIHPDIAMVLSREGKGVAILDVRNDYARASANFGYALSPDGRYLVVNKLSHVEIWNCREIADLLQAPANLRPSIEPWRVFLLPLANPADAWRRGHAPIAMSRDGRLLAVGGVCAVSIWELETGRSIGLVGPVPIGFPEYAPDHTRRFDESVLSVQALAVDTDGLLTVVLYDYREQIIISTWKRKPE